MVWFCCCQSFREALRVAGWRAGRRSAVSRQVCRLLEVLAVELQGNFNALALHFVGDLLKVLVITVQVCRPRRSGRPT